jgi:formamidopyrimidine-DNA glycosylase
MPELPEVETIANGVHARVQGQRILSVWTSGKPQTFKSPEAEIADTLTGATIESVRRVGKTIVMTVIPGEAPGGPSFAVSSQRVGSEFLIHLGMTGRLLVSEAAVPHSPHTHAVLTLADAREIRFVDPRRFGRLSIHPGTNLGAPGLASETWEGAPQNATPAGYTGHGREPLTISLASAAAKRPSKPLS